MKYYSTKIANAFGWSNPSFREQHKKDTTITPSHNYEKLKDKLAKLKKHIFRCRKNYQNVVSKRLVESADEIGIESLSVTEMQTHRKEDRKGLTNKVIHRKNSNISDSAMSAFLGMIKYKSDMYGRTLKSINRYYPSTQVCSVCGYQNEDLRGNTQIRSWICPKCGTHHDRDVNAAVNIMNVAFA